MELLKYIAALIDKHGTKVIGYVAIAAAFVAFADKKLIADTLGPNASSWALLTFGLLGAARGHQATAKEKRDALDDMVAKPVDIGSQPGVEQ